MACRGLVELRSVGLLLWFAPADDAAGSMRKVRLGDLSSKVSEATSARLRTIIDQSAASKPKRRRCICR